MEKMYDCDEHCYGCPFYDSVNICNLLDPLYEIADSLENLELSLNELHSNIERDFLKMIQ